MKKINFIKGDATNPQQSGNKIIVHICNDIGAWGKGFVLAISKHWREPEKEYKDWYKSGKDFELGRVQFVKTEKDIWVANIIGQHGITEDENGSPPIRYQAVEEGLEKIGEFAKKINASIHMPRIGCGLARGNWDKIELIILNKLSKQNIAVTVYDFAP